MNFFNKKVESLRNIVNMTQSGLGDCTEIIGQHPNTPNPLKRKMAEMENYIKLLHLQLDECQEFLAENPLLNINTTAKITPNLDKSVGEPATKKSYIMPPKGPSTPPGFGPSEDAVSLYEDFTDEEQQGPYDELSEGEISVQSSEDFEAKNLRELEEHFNPGSSQQKKVKNLGQTPSAGQQIKRRGRDENIPPSKACPFCQNIHWAQNCDQFVTAQDRIKQLEIQKRCLCCFEKGHTKPNCREARTCRRCLYSGHVESICLIKDTLTWKPTRFQLKKARQEGRRRVAEKFGQSTSGSSAQQSQGQPIAAVRPSRPHYGQAQGFQKNRNSRYEERREQKVDLYKNLPAEKRAFLEAVWNFDWRGTSWQERIEFVDSHVVKTDPWYYTTLFAEGPRSTFDGSFSDRWNEFRLKKEKEIMEEKRKEKLMEENLGILQEANHEPQPSLQGPSKSLGQLVIAEEEEVGLSQRALSR